MATYKAQAERPNGTTPGASYVEASIEARDNPDGGDRQGVATLRVVWGKRPGSGTLDDGEQGREEYTRLARDVESAIDAVRDAAVPQQKGESRRYIEIASSRALLAVLEERDFWRRAAEVAEAFVREWTESPPGSRSAMEEAVRAVVVTERQFEAVMGLIGQIMKEMTAKTMSEMASSEGAVS